MPGTVESKQTRKGTYKPLGVFREASMFTSMKPIMQAKDGLEPVLKLGWAQSSTEVTTGPDLHPEHLEGNCVAVRFKGSDATLSVDDAIEYMKAKKYNRGSTSKPLSVGLLFMDIQGCRRVEYRQLPVISVSIARRLPILAVTITVVLFEG
jgi:hypothetical protein